MSGVALHRAKKPGEVCRLAPLWMRDGSATTMGSVSGHYLVVKTSACCHSNWQWKLPRRNQDPALVNFNLGPVVKLFDVAG